MLHDSWLMAHSSFAKGGRLGLGGLEARPKVRARTRRSPKSQGQARPPWPWAMSHEAWALSHEPWVSRQLLVKSSTNYYLMNEWMPCGKRLKLPPPILPISFFCRSYYPAKQYESPVAMSFNQMIHVSQPETLRVPHIYFSTKWFMDPGCVSTRWFDPILKLV